MITFPLEIPTNIRINIIGANSPKLANELSKKLEAMGKSVTLISCHTIKPLDNNGIKDILESHKHNLVIEEHVPHGGLSSRVKEIALETKNILETIFPIK